GRIPFRGRDIPVQYFTIEEDSCREVSDEGHLITFRTDRLSTPLSETVTAPEMRTPQEVAEVCELAGRLARVTGKVRRGLGSARQDVNVSVTGGRRVELKGVSRIASIPKLVHNEALRQARLLGIREHLQILGLSPETIDGGSQNATVLFRESRAPLLRRAAAEGQTIRVAVIRGGRRTLRAQTQPGILFAQELSGRVRVIACLDAPVNLFIRDEDHGIGLARHHWEERRSPELLGPSRDEWQRLARRVGASDEDGLVLVWGSERDTLTAAREIRERVLEALEGVPNETRMPMPEGRTDFERILPGPDRMYPDTDLPPMPIGEARLERIRLSLPDPPWVREAKLRKMQIPGHTARRLSLSPHYALFDEMTAEGAPRKWRMLVAWLLTEVLVALRRKGVPVDELSRDDLRTVLLTARRGRVQREALPLILERLARVRECLTPAFGPAQKDGAVRSRPPRRDDENSRAVLEAILVEEFPMPSDGDPAQEATAAQIADLLRPTLRLEFSSAPARERHLMRRVMQRYRGIVAGCSINRLVREWMKANPQPS
ncbi:MAG: hypothetical protein GF355_16835, partial [Candidatus Eisenbacteria bacterium]|nr:hypothetical protein [Candidatus Eisenbacteria bacterium]